MSDNYKELLEEALRDHEVRVAHAENNMRRKIGAVLEETRKDKRITVRGLAMRMGTSPSQVQRVLHKEAGGSLTLNTLVRAADAMDMVVTVNVRPRACAGVIASFGTSASYAPAKDVEPLEETVKFGELKKAVGCSEQWKPIGRGEKK